MNYIFTVERFSGKNYAQILICNCEIFRKHDFIKQAILSILRYKVILANFIAFIFKNGKLIFLVQFAAASFVFASRG